MQSRKPKTQFLNIITMWKNNVPILLCIVGFLQKVLSGSMILLTILLELRYVFEAELFLCS